MLTNSQVSKKVEVLTKINFGYFQLPNFQRQRGGTFGPKYLLYLGPFFITIILKVDARLGNHLLYTHYNLLSQQTAKKKKGLFYFS